jgi:hypothetical protein
MSCLHERTECLNEHELIRKYRCLDCEAVMMCACDERIGSPLLRALAMKAVIIFMCIVLL